MLSENERADTMEEIARELEIAKYLLGEIGDEFFDKYDPKEKDGTFAIVYSFKRYRAYFRAFEKSFIVIRDAFEKLA